MAGASILSESNVNSLLGTYSSPDEATFLTDTTLPTITDIAPPCSRKRKRPPKLQIPSILSEIKVQDLGLKETESKEKKFGGSSGAGWAVYYDKGFKRRPMEDTHKVLSDLHGDPKKAFFGVYDGHGGLKAAEYVAEKLHENIFEMLEKCGDMGKEEAIKSAFLKTDQDFLKLGSRSGSCCVTALIGKDSICLSNLGDCRAVLCRGGVAVALTDDHNPGRADERDRIEQKGGHVSNHHGTCRVQGILSVSRSIGDAHLKEWVLGEPETVVLPLTSDMEFLILASDGLWCKVTNEEAIDQSKEDEDESCRENTCPPLKVRRVGSPGHREMNSGCVKQEKYCKNSRLMAACKRLVQIARALGSLDDITVMIIDLKHFQQD